MCSLWLHSAKDSETVPDITDGGTKHSEATKVSKDRNCKCNQQLQKSAVSEGESLLWISKALHKY